MLHPLLYTKEPTVTYHQHNQLTKYSNYCEQINLVHQVELHTIHACLDVWIKTRRHIYYKFNIWQLTAVCAHDKHCICGMSFTVVEICVHACTLIHQVSLTGCTIHNEI